MAKTTVYIDFASPTEQQYWGGLAAMGMLRYAVFVPVPTGVSSEDGYRELTKFSEPLCRCGHRRLMLPSVDRRFGDRRSNANSPVEGATVRLGTDFLCLGPLNADARSAFVGLKVSDGNDGTPRGDLQVKPFFTVDRGWPYENLVDMTDHIKPLPSGSADEPNPVLTMSRKSIDHPLVLGIEVAAKVVPVCRIIRNQGDYSVRLARGVSRPVSHEPHNCQ